MPIMQNPIWVAQHQQAPTVVTGTAAVTGAGAVTAQNAGFFIPDSSNTGYLNAPGYPGSLADGSNITVVSNTTYSFYRNLGINSPNNGLGTPSVPVTNVTCIGCSWEPSGGSVAATTLFGAYFTFKYCSFLPTGYVPGQSNTPVPEPNGYQYGIIADGVSQSNRGTYNTWANGVVMEYCDAWGFGNGAARLSNGMDATHPYVVLNCYFHNSLQNADDVYHQDGIGSPGGGDINYTTLTNVRVESQGNTNAIVWSSGICNNLAITGSLIGGFGYSIHLDGTPLNSSTLNNVTFNNNQFSTWTQCFFGPLYNADVLTAPGSTWSGNTWLVPTGSWWGNPVHNGWVWAPTANGPANGYAPGSDDTTLVSAPTSLASWTLKNSGTASFLSSTSGFTFTTPQPSPGDLDVIFLTSDTTLPVPSQLTSGLYTGVGPAAWLQAPDAYSGSQKAAVYYRVASGLIGGGAAAAGAENPHTTPPLT